MIRRSPLGMAARPTANFGLKNYDQAIELARQAIAINPNYVQFIHVTLVAALALTGHDAEAREALKRYLALPSTGPLKTISACKAYFRTGRRSSPRRDERADVRRPAQGGDAGAVSETRRFAAILAADVVGYSRLMGDDEAGTARAVREHREAATPIVRGFGGRLVKTMGDGVLLEFPSVVAAVECAIRMQQQMAERNAGVPEARRILYRIGVNLGDVLIDGEDILGDGVNIAARLEAICEPGGICISGSAYDHVRGRIEAEFVDLGERALKNIARPVRAYALGVADIACAKVLTPAATPRKRRFGLAPLVAALAALLIVIAASAWWFLNANRPANFATKAPAEAARLSIVVLPFANLSGDPAQDYLVDALTDELTTSLARIPGAFVIAHNTAMTFKGKPVDAKAIGKDLGVRYVLEGSVQPSGDRMRVNAQLIDAGSGAHLWAEQFDTPRADLLQTQDAIVTHLAHKLDFQLPRPRPPVSNGRPRPIATPRIWLFNARRALRPGSARRRRRHTRSANRRSPSIPTMSAP